MRAMILCAGLGTRLRPLTERWPKPAIPLLGAPLLRYNLALLAKAGVQEIGINTHHLAETMDAIASEEAARLGLGFTSVNEPIIQGTGGGIRGLRSFFAREDAFVVFNGDILYAIDLGPVIERHKASKAAATMLLLPMPKNETYGAVECDADFRVRRIAGHGPGGEGLSPWHFTGVHILTPAVFDFMAPSGEEDINRRVYPAMMAKGLVIRGEVAPGYWSDLGTPTRYLKTVFDLLEGQIDVSTWGTEAPLAHFAKTRSSVAQLWHLATEGAASDERAQSLLHVRGSVVIEKDVVVETGAVLEGPLYLGPGVHIGRGARVARSVILEGTAIRSHERLSDVIAWREHRIAAS